jgi:starch phosphorylase
MADGLSVHGIPAPARYGDPQRTGLTARDLFDGITEHLFYTLGSSALGASDHDLYMALSYAVRDRLMTRHLAYKDALRSQRPKAVAYLSAEFLIGPQLANNLYMLGIRDAAAEALKGFGVQDIERILDVEEEPGLGNGGLGRLAACFIESMATLEIPATGYGIRYEFGIFDQRLHKGWQVEVTDTWLKGGWPWEVVHSEKSCLVGFAGHTEIFQDDGGHQRVRWLPAEHALGIPHDVPVLGYRVNTCNRLRLWRAEATEAFDFHAFNGGNFRGAVEAKVSSETLSKILYPNDGTDAGRRLRLKQQFFFVSCSLQDMIRNLVKRGIAVEEFARHWAVQLNDTHPAIAVAELMRLLVDEHHLSWEKAWDVVHRSITYTNHTLLPEALECWQLQLFASVLPRHLEIIYEINRRFLQWVRLSRPGDSELVERVSLIAEHDGKAVRMANLAAVACRHINGVAELHSELVRDDLLPEFAALHPERFTNVTNGVTPRRWLAVANPPLNLLLAEVLGDDWAARPAAWGQLEAHQHDPAFLDRWAACKQSCKQRLTSLIAERTGENVDPTSLFDVQVKRIHEYKRQHLNGLQVVSRYLRIKHAQTDGLHPRTVIFGGKAAPGYWMAKLIIRFLHGVADVVNNDPDSKDLLKVVFLADYNIKLGEKVYPAADLSEQISTAGLEASGTGNMKLTMNGALTIGTLDGANIEIRERVGADNFFLFGRTAQEIADLRCVSYRPWERLEQQPLLQEAFRLIEAGFFSEGDSELFRPLLHQLSTHDPFFVLEDIEDYGRAQGDVDRAWADRHHWQRMSLLNMARSGFFSSDRAIRTYASSIWGVSPLPVAMGSGH